jgi:CysZ protein
VTSKNPSLQNYRAGSANPFYHFGWGMRFFFAGLRMLIRHPALLALSLIPIALTVVLLLSLAFGCAWLIGQLLAELFGNELKLLAQIMTFLLALLLGYFAYLPLARVLLAPFSEMLSRKAHAISTGTEYRSGFSWSRAMIEGLKLALFHIAAALAALVLSILFPPVGTPMGIVVAVFLCGLDFLDVPLSARGMPFGKKLGVIGRNKALALGFGTASYLMLLIPGINLLSLPVGVIGATLLTDQLELSIE